MVQAGCSLPFLIREAPIQSLLGDTFSEGAVVHTGYFTRSTFLRPVVEGFASSSLTGPTRPRNVLFRANWVL